MTFHCPRSKEVKLKKTHNLEVKNTQKIVERILQGESGGIIDNGVIKGRIIWNLVYTHIYE